MCWGTVRMGSCSGSCGWRLAPESDPASPIFACDAHLADAIRFMGVPAIVITSTEEDTQELTKLPSKDEA